MSEVGLKFGSVSHWGAYTTKVEDGRIVGVEPFSKDPNPSPIIEALPSAVHHKSRIARPMVRKGFLDRRENSDRTSRGAEPFVPVSWDEALDLVAHEIERVRSAHGNEAIYGTSGWASAGVFHNAFNQLKRFLNGAGGFVDQVTNYSFGAASIVMPHITGGMESIVSPTTWPNIASNTKLMVMFGGVPQKNTQISKDGVGAHKTMDWLREGKAAGMEFVYVGPCRDDMPAFLGADWLAARPNTDAALMIGLAHTLISEGLHDQDFLDRYCAGFDRFRPYLMGETDGVPKDADWAAAITEIDAGTIRGLARRMAATRCMITAGWSVQRTDHGEQPMWAAMALAAMLGQIGLPGGGFGIGYGAMDSIGGALPKIPVPVLPVGQNPVSAFIPVARVSDMLLNPGETFAFNGQDMTYPDARLVYWCGGNAFHQQQDINRLLQAWQKPETIIIHEPWWTPAARRADIVLPCTTTLERNDIGAARFDRFYFAMQKAVDAVGASRNEFDIFSDLADRLGFRETFTEAREENDWLRHLYDVARQDAARMGFEMPSFDAFWELGHFEFPEETESRIVFEPFRIDPESNPLNTPSGKLEIYSERIAGFGYDDCPGHPVWMEPGEWLGAEAAQSHPLHLISNAPTHRMHSQMDCGTVSQAAKIQGREPVWLNTDDAEARNIRDGDVVRIFNDRGACLAGAVITDSMRTGVVQLPTGAWYDPLEPGQISSLDKHGNPNVLTMDKGTSSLGQSSIAQSALVQVELYEGPVPEITAFDPPLVEMPQ